MTERASIFDDEALEAAANAVRDTGSLYMPSDKKIADAALRAAEASLIERGALRYGDHRLRIKGPAIPVVIIKLSRP